MRLRSLDLRTFRGSEEFGREIGDELAGQYGLDLRTRELLEWTAAAIYRMESFEAKHVAGRPSQLSSIEGARYREALRARIEQLSNPAVVRTFRDAVTESLSAIARAVPNQPSAYGQLSFMVPFAAIARDLPIVLTDCILPYYSEAALKHRLFVELRAQCDRNLHELSAVPLAEKDSPKLIMPERYKGTRLIGDYLGNTVLERLFEAPTSVSIPDERRFEHMHIVAGTGHGKTQTLQRLILADLETDAGLVIVDSQGEMLRKIARLETNKEIIYVDPTDIASPPALNMFDVSRLDGLPPVKREQFLNGLIELLEYVFAGLLKAELTQKQNVLFRYTLRLMLAIPNATMIDLVKFLSDPEPYLVHAKSLNPMAQEFFAEGFRQKSYIQTREQIRRRLYGVLENDSFRRMFSSPRNELSLPDALNRGAVVLVDTAKSHLKSDASSLMGRYFIALTLQAALEREAVDTPAFLYIDEAGEYFDDNIDSLLNEARKRRVGIVMAHQCLDQLTPQLRASIATNTAVKMAGGVSDKDARALAADMRCDPQLITAQTTGNFACYIKGVTAQAVTISIPFGMLEAQPTKPEILLLTQESEEAEETAAEEGPLELELAPEPPKSAEEPLKSAAPTKRLPAPEMLIKTVKTSSSNRTLQPPVQTSTEIVPSADW